MSFFTGDYFAAKRAFRAGLQKAGGRLETLPLAATGPAGETLSIDIGWFGPENPRRVMLHSSGLHGVEGFAGSAIQLQLLDEIPSLPEGTALVLTHVLNPYGMAWLRRVNENNVDLNRNFLRDESYAGAPAAYAKLDSFLNPQSPPARDLYKFKVVLLILKYGMPALKKAVVGGQYEHPKGLFFGGKHLEAGPKNYESFLAARLGSVERIIAIDVHTGLGKFGEDTLLVPEKDYDRLRRIFGERVSGPDPSQGPAYRARGSHDSLLPGLKPDADILFLTQEFGTYSGVQVLHALREENRWHHYGSGGVDHPAKRKLKQTFCPDDESWRRSVLRRGKDLLEKALISLSS